MNLLNEDGTTQSSKSVENTTWHEVGHANDGKNITTDDREKFANSVGSAGSGIASVNNFFYGNGGLTDSSIATNYNTNKNSTIAQNNQVAGILTLTGQREDSSYLVSKGIGSKDGYKHNFLIVTGTEEFLKQSASGDTEIIKTKGTFDITTLKGDIVAKIDYNLSDVLPDISSDETHFILIAGYTDSNTSINGLLGALSENGNLVYNSNGNEPSDLQTLIKDSFTGGVLVNNNSMENLQNTLQDNRVTGISKVKKIEFNNNKTIEENDKAIIDNARSYGNNAPYVAAPTFKGQNSNSFANSVCIYAGGSNCSTNTFGGQTLIDPKYFKYDINNTQKTRQKIFKEIQINNRNHLK